MSVPGDDQDSLRVQRAMLAHLRQELVAPAAAIVGYTDILLDDARRLSLAAYMPDLERIHGAGQSLHALLQSVLAHERDAGRSPLDASRLRHDLRTPINAIKGYGEMLVEDATEAGHRDILADLEKLLAAAEGMLRQIDALVDFTGRPAAQQAAGAASVVAAMRAIGDAAATPATANLRGRILVVDDNASNRDLLGRQLARAGHTIVEADNGRAAIEELARRPADLVLLDMIMPGLSGYEVLRHLKTDPATADIPVIMISALDDLDSVTRCIEAGAIDYLFKPFDPTLLRARIGASLENKILRDREKTMMEELQREKALNEDLLLSILPRSVVERIHGGETMIADHVHEVSILFADIVNFTHIAGRQTPGDLVRFLNSIFSAFDALTQRFGAEKIKTIGDAYMAAFGLPEQRPDHAEAAAHQARAMLAEIGRFRTADGQPVSLRIGIHSGPAIAGVIGKHRFSFDVWGTTVNIASRMESLGEPGKVHVSAAVAEALAGKFKFARRRAIAVKGAGKMRTFFLGDPL